MPRKLAVCDAARLALAEYEEPPLISDEVRIRCLHGAAKHGTELEFFSGYARCRGRFDSEYELFRPVEAQPAGGDPPSFGNMSVGEVIEVGDQVRGTTVGQRVCYYGPFQETHIAKASACRAMPESMDWRSAVCLDPAVFAFAAVRDGNIRIGDAAAVFGLGAIGLMAIQFLRIAGAYPIIAIDPLASRRDVATKLGATVVLDPVACDAGLEIKEATGKRGADVVIEYSGNVHAMQAALRGVAYGGNVVAGAFPPPYPAGLDLGAEAHMNVPNIIFSRACSEPNRDHPRWSESRITETCWRMLCEDIVSGREIVQPVVPFSQLADEYSKLGSQPAEYLKLGVAFEGSSYNGSRP